MRVPKTLLMLLRVLIAAQIVMGLGLWLGYWLELVKLHMALGSIFVLCLWGLAGFALAKRSAIGLAGFAIVWGLLLAGFGMAQQKLLIGDLHWIIRLMHLVIGLAAMPIAERLARAAGGEGEASPR